MSAFPALSTIGAESGKVERAKSFPHMFFTATGSERAESFLVVGTRRNSGHGVDVRIVAIVTGDAVTRAVEGRTFWPGAEVVLV